jgi:hypothetical protein
MPLTEYYLQDRARMSFGPYHGSGETIIRDWGSLNFKASTNRAKNGTLLLNYLDTTTVRTERFSALVIGQT